MAQLPLPSPREGPSPFLEGTAIQYAWDSTCLGWLKRCPRLYQLSMIEGWRPKDENVHLTFGIRYTNALEYYHKLRAEDGGQNYNHDMALGLVVEKALLDTWVPDEDPVGEDESPGPGHPWTTDNTQKNRYTLLRAIIWYLDQYEHDPAVTVIAEDGTPLVERSFRMELDWGPAEGKANIARTNPEPQPYLLCGHLDRVVTFLGSTFGMDHKTTKTTIGSYYFDQYEPNNQMTLYTIATRVIFNVPIRGMIIDAIQTAVTFAEPARGVTYRTPTQLEEWLKDLRYHLDAAERYATDQYWPMNDTACFNCSFNKHDSKICAKDPAVRGAFLASHFTKEDPWNPLKARN